MNPWLTLVTVGVRFPGCSSLKERRQRSGGIKDRVGKLPGFAVVESPDTKRHDSQTWVIAVLASDAQVLQRQIAQLEKTFLASVNGEITLWEQQHI